MPDDSDPQREAIHNAIQAQGVGGEPGALLTGWALVTQWADGNGDVWLARSYSATSPAWAAKGMWHEALYGDWPA